MNKNWISILEASFIIYLLQPHTKNYNKRLIKSPRLYFHDTGLACNLLNIETVEQLDTHYNRGSLFENFVINELQKSILNQAKTPNLYFFRNKHRKEIDCIIELPNTIIPLEIKSGKTF